MLFSNLGSLNSLNQSRDFSYAGNITVRVPSASTVARSTDTIDLDRLREILKTIYLKAKRPKMIEPLNGRYVRKIGRRCRIAVLKKLLDKPERKKSIIKSGFLYF